MQKTENQGSGESRLNNDKLLLIIKYSVINKSRNAFVAKKGALNVLGLTSQGPLGFLLQIGRIRPWHR